MKFKKFEEDYIFKVVETLKYRISHGIESFFFKSVLGLGF